MPQQLSDVQRRLIQLVDTHFNRQRILVSLTTKLRSELRMDSLDLTELCLESESEFKIELTDNEFDSADSVGELAELITQKRGMCKS